MVRPSKRQARAKQELADLGSVLPSPRPDPAQEASRSSEEEDEQAAEEDGDGGKAAGRAGGAFAALAMGGEEGDAGLAGSEEEEAPEPATTASKARELPALAPLSCRSCLAEQAKKKSKKKKAKKRHSEGAPDGQAVEGQTPPTTEVMAAPVVKKQPADDLDEIDRALQELGVKRPAASKAATSSAASSTVRDLLAIDVKMLDADAELRRMFGSKVIAAAPRANPSRGGYHPRLSNNPHHAVNQHLSKSSLARPQGTWPPYGAATGAALSMRQLSPTEHHLPPTALSTDQCFTFEHTPGFRSVQAEFMQAVLTMDPNELVALLRFAPYHPDTLLQLADVSAHQGDPGQSADFLDRAIYAYERGFGGLFSSAMAKGDARVEFSRVENRGFFRALEKKVASLAKRGCWRTACEFGKLLLAMDPYQDPFGALLLLDFLAPKAKEYRWLLDLLDDLPGIQDPEEGLYIEAYPGLAYAKALSLWHLESAPNATHLESTRALRTAMLRFPMVLPPLSDKTGFPLPAAFLRVGRSKPQTAFSKDPAYILHLQSQLYVIRAADLWKEEGVTKWLAETAVWCGEVLEGRRPALLQGEGGEAWEAAEEERKWGDEIASGDGAYGAGVAPGGILRNIFVSDIPQMKAFLPPSIQQSTSFSFDPLPPPDSSSFDDGYFSLSLPSRRSRPSAHRAAGFLPDHEGLVAALDRPRGIQELLERMQVALQADEQGVEMTREERREMVEQLDMLLAAQRRMEAGEPPGAMPGAVDEEEDEELEEGPAEAGADGEAEGEGEGPGLMGRLGAWWGRGA